MEDRALLRRLGPVNQPVYLLMDRAYEGDDTRALAAELGYIPVVPPKSNRKNPWDYDKQLCRQRNQVRSFFAVSNDFVVFSLAMISLMLSFFPLSILPLLSMPLCEHNLESTGLRAGTLGQRRPVPHVSDMSNSVDKIDLNPGSAASINGPENPVTSDPVLLTVSDDRPATHASGSGVPPGGYGEGVLSLCLYGESLSGSGQIMSAVRRKNDILFFINYLKYGTIIL